MRLTTYDASILALRPLAYYPLGERGSIAKNIAPSSASLDGSAVGSPKRGLAPLLPNDFTPSTGGDGTSMAFTTPTGALNASMAAITVACWVNTPSTSSYGRFCSTNEVSSILGGFELNEGAPGDLEFYLSLSTGAALTQIASGAGTQVANQLFFVVGTSDGLNARLYVNGRQAATAAFVGSVGGGAAMQIMRDGAGFGWYEGRLSRLAIWNKALSAPQVLELYRLGLAPGAVHMSASTLLPAAVPPQAGMFWSSSFGSPTRG